MSSFKSLVLDVGAAHLRGGYAGESSPRFILPHRIFETELRLLRWYLQELINKMYIDRLLMKPKQSNILIVEKVHMTRVIRDFILTVLLQDFHVHSVSFQPDLYMSLLPSGFKTGVVLNISSDECQAICIADGRPLIQTLKTASVGTRTGATCLAGILNEVYSRSYTAADVEPIFERVACHSFPMQLTAAEAAARRKRQQSDDDEAADEDVEPFDDGKEGSTLGGAVEETAAAVEAETTADGTADNTADDTADVDVSAVITTDMSNEDSAGEHKQKMEEVMVEVSDIEIFPAQCLPMGVDEADETIDSFMLAADERQQCLSGIICGECPKEGCVDENGGAAGVLLRSLRACSRDVRFRAAEHIIICGGGSMIPGIQDAICAKATEFAKEDDYFSTTVKHLLGHLPNGRFNPLRLPYPHSSLAFVGGSLFASVPENKAKFVTLQDIESRGKYSVVTAIRNAESSDSKATPLPPVGAAGSTPLRPPSHSVDAAAGAEAGVGAGAGAGESSSARHTRSSDSPTTISSNHTQEDDSSSSDDERPTRTTTTATATVAATVAATAVVTPPVSTTATPIPLSGSLAAAIQSKSVASASVSASSAGGATRATVDLEKDRWTIWAAPDWQSLDNSDWSFYRLNVIYR